MVNSIKDRIMKPCSSYIRGVFYERQEKFIEDSSKNLTSENKVKYESMVINTCTYDDFEDIIIKYVIPFVGEEYCSERDYLDFCRKSTKMYWDVIGHAIQRVKVA